MDIRISDYILNGLRVLSTECSICQICITICAQDALKLSFGFDLGGKECSVNANQSLLLNQLLRQIKSTEPLHFSGLIEQ